MSFKATHRIKGDTIINHHFDIGSEVRQVERSRVVMWDGTLYHEYKDVTGKSQYVHEDDVQSLETTLTSGEVEEKRVKYLYVVTGRDGENYIKTFDRDFAREVKATEGGKKAGVIITAYAPVKEIR